MTTSVDPRLIAEINALEIPCETRDRNWRRCTDPAAWLVTWTARAGRYTDIVPTCIGHMADLLEHRPRCTACRAAFDITAVEL